MPLQTFRYAACGGANTILDIVMYAIAYNFILHKQDLDLSFMVFKPHIASIIIREEYWKLIIFPNWDIYILNRFFK